MASRPTAGVHLSIGVRQYIRRAHEDPLGPALSFGALRPEPALMKAVLAQPDRPPICARRRFRALPHPDRESVGNGQLAGRRCCDAAVLDGRGT